MTTDIKYKFVIVLICFGVLSSTGCRDKVASKLAGKWNMMTPDKIEESQIDSGSSPASKNDSQKETAETTEDLYNSLANGETIGSMSLVFHRNGQLQTFTDFPMASTGKPKIGTWKTKSWDESTQTAIIECNLFDEFTETKIQFIDDATIRLVPPNLAAINTELMFQRDR